MSIRREQALFLVVLALGAWIWTSSSSTKTSSQLRWDRQSYEAAPPPIDPLLPAATASARLLAVRDPFREPSESEPLPPRVLLFPELGALPVVAVPQHPGQHPGAYHQLRLPGGVAEDFQFGGDGQGDAGVVEAVDPGVGEIAGGGEAAAPEKLYDSIVMKDTRTMYGFIRSPNKYELVDKRTFTEPVVYDWIALKTGEIIRPGEEVDQDEIVEVKLADTLRNRVELRRRRLGDGPASLPKRAEFIRDLLRHAERDPWTYVTAAKQADRYVEISGGAVDGYQLVVAVVRARGDLSGEWAFYESLPAELRGSAFHERSIGEFKAMLGLVIEAEEHLRRAVELEPQNPRARLSLARFLLDDRRAAAALEQAEGARRNRSVLFSDEEQFGVWETLVRVHLALGNVGDARSALRSMPIGEAFGARRDELAGAVDYADGNWDAALSRFAAAVSAGGGGRAALGSASCLVALGRWQEAESSLQAAAEQHPLLRQRALAGLGLLYERTGNLGPARDALEAAIRVDPRDPYVLYLLGRVRRQLGLFEDAVDVLAAALDESDDLVEAHAEMASAYLAMSEGGGEDLVTAINKARRHVDRLVELDATRGRALRFRELQGVIRFWQGDYGAARLAFAEGASSGDDGSLLCRAGNALVEYRQNRVQDARALLLEMKDELRTGDPMRDYADATIALIDDHAAKEQVRDAFDRDDLGRNWADSQRNGAVGPTLTDGAMRIAGRLSAAARPVFARRVQPEAGNFLAAEITMVVATRDDSKMAGLELSMASRGRSAADLRVRFGVRHGKPYLLIEDGDVNRAREEEERARWDPVELSGVSFAPGQPQRLELRLVPREEERRFQLEAYWNDDLLHTRSLDKLTRRSSGELFVDLVVEGSQGDTVDVTFDDFRMVRRRDK